MIKCKDCGNENPFEAVFCRECGTELDLEYIPPKKINRKVKDVGALVKKFISVGILLVIMLLILGLTVSAGLKEFPVLEGEDAEVASQRYEQMLAVITKKDNKKDKKDIVKTYTFSGPELTHLYKTKLLKGLTVTGGSSIIDEVVFHVDEIDSSKICLIFKSKIGGVLSLRFELQGNIVTNDNENSPIALKYDIKNAYIGYVPLSFLSNSIQNKFSFMLNSPENTTLILNNISSISIDDSNNFVINLK